MEEHDKNEKLIGDLIKKRKQANNAFAKLLNAIEGKGATAEKPSNDKSKPKS